MKSLVERLLALDSCAVSDAMDSLGLAGAVPGLVRRTGTRRIAGPVRTVKLAAGKPPGGSKQHLGTQAIEAAAPGDIIVVEQATGVEASGWGGVLSNAAMVRKVAGVIVEGPARDIDEAAELDFPIYSRRVTCITARGRIYEAASAVPIVVGGVPVAPGDYALADGSGAVFIPADTIEQVIGIAESIAERERLMTRDVHAGAPVGSVMGTNYETMLEMKL